MNSRNRQYTINIAVLLLLGGLFFWFTNSPSASYWEVNLGQTIVIDGMAISASYSEESTIITNIKPNSPVNIEFSSVDNEKNGYINIVVGNAEGYPEIMGSYAFSIPKDWLVVSRWNIFQKKMLGRTDYGPQIKNLKHYLQNREILIKMENNQVWIAVR